MAKVGHRFFTVFCFLMAFMFIPATHVRAVYLSDEEREYLRKKGTVVFVSQTSYPPFEFIQVNGQREGMMIDIANWLAVEMGFKTLFVDTSFQQAQESILSGKTDIITSLFYSDKRNEKFEFTATLFNVPVSIFVKAERTDIKDLSNLNGKTIAIQKGDYAKEFLESRKINFVTLDTKDFAEATDMVIAGKADAVIGDEQIVLYHIFSNRLTDRIKKIGDPLYTGRNCMASNKENAMLVRILNKGVMEARKTGVLDKISQKWLGTIYGPRESLLEHYLWPLSAAAGGILLLLMWVWFWNARLRVLVRKKTEVIAQREAALRESEERYRSIFENAVEGIFQSTPEGRFISVNPAMTRIIGYDTPQEMMEQITSIEHDFYVDPEHRLMFKKLLDTIDTVEGFESNVYRKDRSRIWISEKTRAVRDAGGNILYYEGAVEDITEEKRIKEELKRSEATYRTVFDNTGTAMIIVNEDTIITLCNREVVKLTGYSKEEIENKKSWTEFVHEEDLQRTREYHFQRRSDPDRIPRQYEIRLVDRSGKIRHVFNTVALIPGTKMSVSALLDISELKNLEKQLLQAKKMEAIGTLAGGVAHDFNNILMGVQGNVSLMLYGLQPDHAHYKKLRSLEEHIKRGADLTKQLLGFARGGKYEVVPTNVNELIRKSAELFGKTRKDIIIHMSLEEKIDAMEVDRGQIEQVLLNLYINAWQAMPDGGRLYLETTNITLDQGDSRYYSLKPGRYVRISVRDTGTGMDEGTIQRVFDPFFTTRSVGGGTGLGLASAYGIVRNHGGSIHVHSEEGRGSVFSVFLPVSDKQVAPETWSEEKIWKGTETILLVDDEKIIVETAAAMLTKLGYHVYAAGSGQEALSLYRQKGSDIDLVILDMILPGLSGGKTYEALKEINPDVKVILCSGYSINSEAKDIMKKGCNAFVQKPYQWTDFSLKIRQILSGQGKTRPDELR